MGGDLEAMPVEQKVKGKIVGFANDPGFGPPRNMVKTDNFKVKERPPRICVVKYEDTNGNGVQDAGEPEITRASPGYSWPSTSGMVAAPRRVASSRGLWTKGPASETIRSTESLPVLSNSPMAATSWAPTCHTT